MKKLIILSAILVLLTSCFISIRVPTSAYKLIIENPTDSPITVTSSSFTKVRSVAIAASSSKEVEVSGVYDDDIILKASGRYYTGNKGMAVRINGDPVLRCSMVPDLGWVKLTNSTGYTISDIRVDGRSTSLYDEFGNEYYNRFRNGSSVYFPVYKSDFNQYRTIGYEVNGCWRSYQTERMPIAGKQVSVTLRNI
ncbi:MAG: hypothetical protein ACI4NM_11790 [Bullifex sp.]